MSEKLFHTPWPWNANSKGEIHSPSGDIIAKVYDNPGEDEAELNILLIQAAPVLLEACRQIAFLQTHRTYDCANRGEPDWTCSKCIALDGIAKATLSPACNTQGKPFCDGSPDA